MKSCNQQELVPSSSSEIVKSNCTFQIPVRNSPPPQMYVHRTTLVIINWNERLSAYYDKLRYQRGDIRALPLWPRYLDTGKQTTKHSL